MGNLLIGNTSSDPRVLNKNYSFSYERPVNIVDNCSVFQPTFILEYNSSFTSCNYVYYPEWGRYYYMRDLVMQPGQKCALTCMIDPLMSFKDEIKSLNVMVERQEFKRNPMLVDDNIPIESSYLIEQRAFPYTFPGYVSGRNCVLEIVGGGH